MKTTNIVSEGMESEQVGKDATAMTMDADSSVFMMDMLGKLYARPAQAALREYISNAYDAHEAKGGDLPPIQVSIPVYNLEGLHSESQILSVRDFGNGMSEDEFRTILSRYGKSTKRNSNKQIGGFGLGAKAGFALGDEFFMTSYQNGQGLRVRLFKDSKNQGYVEVVERFKTDEPDGMLVEVSVPRANTNEFHSRSMSYLFWGHDSEKITVLPSSGPLMSVYDSSYFTPLKLNEDIVGWIGKGADKADNFYAIIGAVTYKLRYHSVFRALDDSGIDTNILRYREFFRHFGRTQVINLPISSVELPASREEITLSERSLQTIAGVFSRYLQLLHGQFQTEINGLSYLDAMLTVADFERIKYPRAGEFTWRGKKLSEALLKTSEAHIFQIHVGGHAADASSLPAQSFSKLIHKEEKSVLIPVKDSEDVERTKQTFASKEVRSALSRHLEELGFQHSYDGSIRATCIILPENDPLHEMFLKGTVLEPSVIPSILNEAEERRQMKEAQEENERLAALKAKEDKRLAEASKPTSFLLVTDDRQFLNRVSPEIAYADENVTYYWSEEEITNHNVNKDSSIAFPYECLANDPNNYEIVKDEIGLSTLGSHVQVRTLLSFTLPEESRIILLGAHTDLEGFKAEHPGIRSALHVLLPTLQAKLQDENSDISLYRSQLQIGRKPNADDVPRGLRVFNRALTPAQRKKLDPGFVTAMSRVLQKVSLSDSRGYISETTWENLLSALVADVAPARNSAKIHEEMKEKYPLLFNNMSFNFPRIVEEMVDYINWKSV